MLRRVVMTTPCEFSGWSGNQLQSAGSISTRMRSPLRRRVDGEGLSLVLTPDTLTNDSDGVLQPGRTIEAHGRRVPRLRSQQPN